MRKTWTEQMIATDLAAVIATVGRMPTNAELLQRGQSNLANQISRRGGFLAWAKRLGAARQHSDSDTGWTGEIDLAAKLETKGFSVTRMAAVKAPYDLRVNDILRIDVKAANFAEYGACRGWFYRIGKEPQADVIALYQLDTGVCYFLPWNLCPTSNVTISKDGGKYAAFRDRYDLVETMAILRHAEADNILKLL